MKESLNYLMENVLVNMGSTSFIRWFDELSLNDVSSVGGKNASLGEMFQSLQDKDINVPLGFATTAEAYFSFLKANEIEKKIRQEIDQYHNKKKSIQEVGKKIRNLILQSSIPKDISEEIINAYRKLSETYDTEDIDVAVRSSATAEDLPEASFAGQQESYLNISGEDNLLMNCKKCYASLFTDRAISYREEHGFNHTDVALSIGIQKMIRSDEAGSGVLFTIDTETGFPDVIIINASWGLGENIVQGSVNPDEYISFKPLLKKDKLTPIIDKKRGSKEKKLIYSDDGQSTKNVKTSELERNSFVLTDKEILTLSRWARIIEDHYNKPMDIEWAKDGQTDKLFIVQARPETVQSRKEANVLKTYSLKEKGKKIVEGLSIGDAIAAGTAQIIKNVDHIDEFKKESILVTEMTDPDWMPILKKASGVITDQGGRTSHAAIVSRELGIPAIIGTTNGTSAINDEMDITLSCAEGDKGVVYQGKLDFSQDEIDMKDVPSIDTQIMMNIGSPAAAFRWWKIPVNGIGLARMEFIINNIIKIHPMALISFNELKDKNVKEKINDLTKGYKDKTQFFVDQLSYGIAKIAASQYPDPVIVRTSDFKTNEYENLIGGAEFEKKEDNPMIGFRGAFRYTSKRYEKAFALECKALKKVREDIGLKNIIIMIPFCRTLKEADNTLNILKENGLKRGKNGLQVYIMAEIPSNIILAEEFAERFDGFSIGSNDLTQLVLGVDRDSEELSEAFDENDKAIKLMIKELIQKAHKKNCTVGICGQAPSDYPNFAEFLVKHDIDSISLNPDSVLQVIQHISNLA